jgi:hypothetical protein
MSKAFGTSRGNRARVFTKTVRRQLLSKGPPFDGTLGITPKGDPYEQQVKSKPNGGVTQPKGFEGITRYNRPVGPLWGTNLTDRLNYAYCRKKYLKKQQ